MKKWDKVQMKNVSFEEFLTLTDYGKESMELYYGEVGVIIQYGDVISTISFTGGTATILNEYLEVMPVEVDTLYLVIFYQDSQLKVLPFKSYEDAEQEERELNDYNNVENINIMEVQY